VCKGGASQWLKSDEPIIQIVAKMLEVIVIKLPITAHQTVLLRRLHEVSVLTWMVDVLLLLQVSVTLFNQPSVHVLLHIWVGLPKENHWQ